MTMTTAIVDYIMEDPREAARLEAKVNPHRWVQRYVSHRVGVGADVLCVGCGPGTILREIAALDTSIRGTGLDISPARIKEAKARNRGLEQLEFLCGDAQAMEFPEDRFDLVYSRMLLQYLKDKREAVNEMVRVCRPGGTVLLQDLDGQLLWHYPEDPALQATVEKVVGALATTGFDPFVGRKLFSLAHQAGLENIDVQLEPYHLIAGEIGAEQMKHWQLKLEIAEPQLAAVLGSKDEARKYTRGFLDYLRRPDTLSYSTVFTVTGEKP